VSLSIIRYSLGEALRSLKRSGWGGFASIGAIAASFLIIGVFLLISSNLSFLVSRWKEEVQVTIFLRDGLSSAQLASLKKSLSEEPGVRSLSFITKEQALSDFKKDLQGQEGLLEGLGYNPLPASFEVQLKEPYQSPEMLQELVKRLKTWDGVEDILYGQEWIEQLTLIIRLLKLAGMSLGGLLLLASILIVSNTIRLTIFSRTEEIDLMRLVGTSWAYIRTPFLFQGILQGLIGALLSLLILFLSFRIILWQVNLVPATSYGLIQFHFLRIPQQFFTVIAGALIGGGGGLLSIRRFLTA
jgi:cell division transport system permease protein